METAIAYNAQEALQHHLTKQSLRLPKPVTPNDTCKGNATTMTNLENSGSKEIGKN